MFSHDAGGGQKSYVNKEGCVWGICTAFCLVYGYGFHNKYEHPLTNPYFWGIFAVLTVALSYLSSLAMRMLGHLSGSVPNGKLGGGKLPGSKQGRKLRSGGVPNDKPEGEPQSGSVSDAGTFSNGRFRRNLITAGILLTGWIPYWLAGYPGFFTYDATNAFIQHFYGIEYSTHHPLIHSILIADVFKIMLKIFPENYNAGIVALSWLTMLMGAGVFTYMLDYIRSISNRTVHAVGVVYLAFFPTIGLFSSCSTKDTYTAFWMILFMTKLLKLLDKGVPRGKLPDVVLVLFIGMMLLYRKNVIIAYVIFVPIFMLVIEGGRVRWGIIFAAGLCCYFLGNGFLEYRYHPAHGAVGEMLCVPLQQMARVYVKEGDAMFTLEEKELFDSFHPYSLLDYHELNGDYVKHDMDDGKLRENLRGFLKMWLRIGSQHPMEYAEAFLVNTYQAWYPFCNITGYASQSDSTYTYFKCDVEEPGELDSKLPGFYDFLWELCTETSLYEIPVVGILFPIGIYIMMDLFVLCYGIYMKNRSMCVFAVFMLAVVFTAMCGPLVLPRYYIYLYYTFPLMVGFVAARPKSCLAPQN